MPPQHHFARFSAPVMMASAVAMGILLARGAIYVQEFWSPIIAFPMLLGAAAGLLMVQLAARCWPHLSRAMLVAAALTAGMTLVAGQHYFAYRQYLNNFQRTIEKHPEAGLLGPKPHDFPDLLEISARHRTYGPWELHGHAVWISWILDGLLTIAAASAVAYWRPWAPPSAPPPTGQIE